MTNGAPGYSPAADTREKIAANLSAEMTRARWSGRRMADALGLTQAYVARRASGEVELSGSDIDLFTGFLGVPVTALFVNREKATVTELDPTRNAEARTTDYRSGVSRSPERGIGPLRPVALLSDWGAGRAVRSARLGKRA